MTFAVTSVRELSDSAAAARHIAGTALADGPIGRVGLELEAHCIDLAEPRRRPDWARLRAVIDALPALPGRATVTVEPGGAVELSGPPADGPSAAITALLADHAAVRAAFARAGLGLLLLGADPLRPPHRVHPGGRYRAMARHFEALGTGAAGATMMTGTASIQLNLDAGPRQRWADRFALAHALGPTMIAMTANSPLLAGRRTGWRSARQRAWGRLDPARCGPVLGAGDGAGPAGDWARYALAAPVMLVRAPDPRPVCRRVSFAEWADAVVPLAGRRPTVADLDYHLSTLFPPVRPRRWLEIRYLDAVPEDLWPAVVFTLATLLDDDATAAAAGQIVEPVAAAWQTAARAGLADPRLRGSARRCLELVAPLAPPALAPALDRLSALVERGRCPGDEFAEHADRRGLAAAVTDWAGGRR